MAVYLLGFLGSLAIVAIIQRWPRTSVGFVFWSCAAIVIPCLMAGLRNASIGTDVMGYAKPLFELAADNAGLDSYYASSWWRDGWHYVGPGDFEVGYSMLAWMSARVFGSFQSFLFLTQALTIGPIYLAACRRRRELSMTLVLAIYYLVFFNLSLNMMRQSIAMAFVFLGIFGLYRSGLGLRDQGWCMAALLVALSFHLSAMMGFVVLAVRIYVERGRRQGPMTRRAAFVVGMAVVSLVAIALVRDVLLAAGVPQVYVQYLGTGSVSFKLNELLLRLPMLLLAAMLLANPKKTEIEIFVFTAVAAGVVLSQLTSLGSQNARIAMYFSIFILCVPALLKRQFKQDAGMRLLVTTVSLGYCVVYWVFMYVVMGVSETVPYLFYWF